MTVGFIATYLHGGSDPLDTDHYTPRLITSYIFCIDSAMR